MFSHTTKPHHTAISVSDVERSYTFYQHFGFKKVLEWRASDGSLVLSHLQHPSGWILEVICYDTNVDSTIQPGLGNDLETLGVKHFALHVDDLQAAYDYVTSNKLGEVSEIIHGRTRFDLFFVRDPDGLWVEFVSDKRDLNVDDPEIITERPRLLEGE